MAHLGVNAVAEHAATHPDGPALALGLVPAGTGNDFARSLGLDPDDVDAAAAAARRRGRRGPSVDLTAASGRTAGSGTVLATRLRRPGQRPRQPDAPAARCGALHDRGAGRAADVPAAGVRARDRRRAAEPRRDARRRRQHQHVRRRPADLPGRRPVRRLARRHVIHPVGRAKLLQLLPADAGRPLRLRPLRRAAPGPVRGGLRRRRPRLRRRRGAGPTPVTATSVPGAIRLCLSTRTDARDPPPPPR